MGRQVREGAVGGVGKQTVAGGEGCGHAVESTRRGAGDDGLVTGSIRDVVCRLARLRAWRPGACCLGVEVNPLRETLELRNEFDEAI